jgi:hypothetical protein
MASNEYSANSAPMQPGLRSFVVYDQIPDGCEVHEVQNRDSHPHLRKGDFVIVDTWDRAPCIGELHLIQWKSKRTGERDVVTMEKKRVNVCRGGRGPGVPTELWFVGPYAPQRMMALTGEEVGPAIRWADGPYRDEYLDDIIIGRIVGIYEPDFRKMLGTVA